MSLRTLARNRVGRIFHLLRPFKHVENSLRGIRRAKRLGYPSIDIDLQITSDGVIVACHDNQPLLHGFFDPLRRLARDMKISEHPWRVVARLLARTGALLYRIRRIEDIFRACARYGRNAVVEPKANRLFALDWPWQHMGAVADDYGCALSARALPELGGVAHVAAARRNHIDAWLI